MTITETSAGDTVHALLNAVTAFDYDAAMTLVSEGCQYQNMPMGKAVGPAGVRGVFESFFSPTMENEFRILRELTNGNTVFTEDRVPQRGVTEARVVIGVFPVGFGCDTNL